MTAADVALANAIATLLAGTGRALTTAEIAAEVDADRVAVYDVLRRDNRFGCTEVWHNRYEEIRGAAA